MGTLILTPLKKLASEDPGELNDSIVPGIDALAILFIAFLLDLRWGIESFLGWCFLLVLFCFLFFSIVRFKQRSLFCRVWLFSGMKDSWKAWGSYSLEWGLQVGLEGATLPHEDTVLAKSI